MIYVAYLKILALSRVDKSMRLYVTKMSESQLYIRKHSFMSNIWQLGTSSTPDKRTKMNEKDSTWKTTWANCSFYGNDNAKKTSTYTNSKKKRVFLSGNAGRDTDPRKKKNVLHDCFFEVALLKKITVQGSNISLNERLKIMARLATLQSCSESTREQTHDIVILNEKATFFTFINWPQVKLVWFSRKKQAILKRLWSTRQLNKFCWNRTLLFTRNTSLSEDSSSQ